MIIDCPRCGFSQPKDRYCANCGLDIDHFKPVPEPKLKALAQNTFVQITLVAIVVIALASGIYTAQQKAIKSQLEAAQKQEMQTPTAPPPTPSAAAPAVTNEAPPPPPASRAASTPALTEEEAAAAVESENQALGQSQELVEPAAADATSGAAKAAGTGTPPKSLSIIFLEVPQATLAQLAAENQILNEQDGVTSIMIPSQPTPSSLGSAIVLPGGGSRTLEANRKVDLRFINPTDTGLRIEIGHTYHNDLEFDLEVVAQLRLRTMTDQNRTDTGVNGKYTIPKNATLLIVGMVPRQLVGQEDQSYFSRTPLAIMASPQFQSTQSQFVVMIQPK